MRGRVRESERQGEGGRVCEREGGRERMERGREREREREGGGSKGGVRVRGLEGGSEGRGREGECMWEKEWQNEGA